MIQARPARKGWAGAGRANTAWPRLNLGRPQGDFGRTDPFAPRGVVMGKPYSIFASICISSGLCGALLGSVPAHAQRGYARTLKRNLTEAETDLNEAIKIAPDYAEGFANRANFWTVSHQYDRALADGEQAVRLNSDLPIAHFVRAGAALNLGQYDRAIADYTETMKLRPGAGASVYGLRGLAYHRKHDEAHAVAGRSHPYPDSCAGPTREGDKPHAEHVRG